MSELQAYTQAASAFTLAVRTLFAPVKGTEPLPPATRGAAPPADVIAERAERLVVAAEALEQATVPLLEAADPTVRTGAEYKLLTQAVVEAELARELFTLSGEVKGGGSTPAASTRAVGLAAPLDDLLRALEAPFEAPLEAVRRAPGPLLPPEVARAQLRQHALEALDFIARRAVKVGNRCLQALLAVDAATLRRGAALLGEEAVALLDKVLEGLGGIARRLAAAAARLLIRAYHAVLTLLGRETEQEARRQVEKWVESLKQEAAEEDGEGVFARFVERLFGLETIKRDVEAWIQASTADAAILVQADGLVTALAEGYRAKTEQVERLLSALALVRLVPPARSPQVQVVLTAITAGLLAYTLYAGYDHVDSDRLPLVPDRVQGVWETVRHMLGVEERPEQP